MAIKREPGENPGQSRCGKFHRGSGKNLFRHWLAEPGRHAGNRNKSEDLPVSKYVVELFRGKEDIYGNLQIFKRNIFAVGYMRGAMLFPSGHGCLFGMLRHYGTQSE